MRGFFRISVALALALVAFVACESSQPQSGSQTHFLDPCEGSCPGSFTCLCGVCTSVCEVADECDDLAKDATCVDAPAACSAGKVCDVRCSTDDDCSVRSGARCMAGRCRLETPMFEEDDAGKGDASRGPEDDASVRSKDGATPGSGGEPGIFTDGAVNPFTGCFDVVICPAPTVGWNVLFSADSVGAGAHVVGLEGNVALVEGADGTYYAKNLREGPATVATFDRAGWKLVYAAEHTLGVAPGGAIVAAACRVDGTECELLYATGTDFVELPGGKLPVTGIRGFFLDEEGLEVACVFGDGVRCGSGSWRQMAPDWGTAAIAAVSKGGGLSVAVTVDGLPWAALAGQQGWEREPVLGAGAVERISADGSAAAFVGTGGAVRFLDGRTGALARFDCEAGVELAAFQLRDELEHYTVVTKAGDVYEHVFGEGPRTICRATRLDVGEILGSSVGTCNDARNVRVFTSDVVIGTSDCSVR